jgi:hypothetical protein
VSVALVALVAGQRLRSVAQTRALRVTCTATAAGRCSVRATIAGKTARALRLPRARAAKPYALGTASVRLAKPGRATLRIKLAAKTAAALRRARTARVTLTASAGNGATAKRTVTLKR